MTPRGPSDRLRGLRLQPRDLSVLRTLGEVSLLKTDVIHRRWFPRDRSGEATRRRLRLYANHGLTQQVFLAISTSGSRGRTPTLHRLTKFGAEVVEYETGFLPPRYAKSDPARPHTLLHRAGMAETILSFNDACLGRDLAEPEWVLEYDPVPGAPLKSSLSDRFRLRYDYEIAGAKHTCWPDAGCGFTLKQGDNTWRLAILWEYDRATETLTQVAGKMPGYRGFLQTKAYRDLWPDAQDARVFFVVPSAERLRNIAGAIKEHPAAPWVRLATTQAIATNPLTKPIWHTTTGEQKPILTG